MHTSLPTQTLVSRFNALVAALVVTLAMLSGIDLLADSDYAPLLAGAAAASQRG